MSFKRASQLEQARLRRPVGEMLPEYFETLTQVQQRDILKLLLQEVEAEIAGLNYSDRNDRARRKELGQRKFEIQNQLKAARPKKRTPETHSYLLQAIKEVCGPAVAKGILNRAEELAKQAQSTGQDEVKE